MKRISASGLFVLLLLVVNLRGIFGYILRYGESATSPTYQAFPLNWFLLWRVVVGGLMAIIIICKMKKISIHYTTIYLLVLLFSLICIFQTESFHVQGAARCMIMYGLLFLVIVSNESWIKISHINKSIEFMAAFGLLFLLYQMYQYHYFGVLPAHSHVNKSIRYGSFYNDSLVLGVLLPMFAGYFFNKYQKPFLLLLTAVIVCLVAVLTGTMTAMGIVFLYVVWNFRKRYGLLLFFLCANLVLAIYFIDQIKYLWLFKSGSIAGHLEGFSYFKELGAINLAGLSPLNEFTETGYLLFLYNFGVPVLLIILAFHLKVLSVCHAILLKDAPSSQMRAFTGATEGLTISVLLANFNLPPILFPPVYLMVVIFSAIVIKRSANTNFRRNSRIETNLHLVALEKIV